MLRQSNKPGRCLGDGQIEGRVRWKKCSPGLRPGSEPLLANDKRIAYLPGPSGDRALAARLLRGEERAIAELYEIHAPRLLRLLSRFMPDRALADDALQETFITAFQSLSRLRGVENLQAWLARIAVRKALNQLRSSSRRAQAE